MKESDGHRKEKNIVVTFIVATIFWFSIMLGTWLYLDHMEKLRIYERRDRAVATEEDKKPMRKHGILIHGPFPVCDKETGECEFERKGRRVKL